MNQQVVCVALALVALFGAASAASLGKYSKTAKASLDIMTAGEGSTPVGFAATHAALKVVHEELSKGSNWDFDVVIFEDMAAKALEVYELEKANCEKNLSTLSSLLRGQANEMTANLLPYLRECRRRQEEFCA